MKKNVDTKGFLPVFLVYLVIIIIWALLFANINNSNGNSEYYKINATVASYESQGHIHLTIEGSEKTYCYLGHLDNEVIWSDMVGKDVKAFIAIVPTANGERIEIRNVYCIDETIDDIREKYPRYYME